MFITEKTLRQWGYEPGTWSRDALVTANRAAEAGASDAAIRLVILLAWKRHGARSAGPQAGGPAATSDAGGNVAERYALHNSEGHPESAVGCRRDRQAA